MSRFDPASLSDLIDAALTRRSTLLDDPQTDVGRLFNGVGDGFAGLVVERLGNVLIAQLHEGRLAGTEAQARQLCTQLVDRLGGRAVYRKWFPKDRSFSSQDLTQLHRSAAPWIGETCPPEHVVREHGLRFIVRPYDGYNTGLFLDHRANRQRLPSLVTGRRVLNMFAYTCGYTIAAARAGAADTVSVDVSRKVLEWGKRNLTENGVTLDTHRFICSDVFDYFKRAARQDQRFDLVILDPPTFSRTRRPARTFQLARDLPSLIEGGVGRLQDDGTLLISINHRDTNRRELHDIIRAASQNASRRVREIEDLTLPDDFVGDPHHAQSILVRLR